VEVDVGSLSSEFPNDNPRIHRGVIWVCVEPTGVARPERAPSVDPRKECCAAIGPCDAPASNARAVDHASVLKHEEHPSFFTTDLDKVARWLARDSDDADSILVEELDPIEATLEGLGHGPPTPAKLTTETTVRVDAPTPAIREVVLVGPRSAEPEGTPIDIHPPLEDIAEGGVHVTTLRPPPSDAFTMLVDTLADVAIQMGSPHVAAVLPGLLFEGRLSEPLDAGVAEALRAGGVLSGTEVAPAFLATTCAWRAILRGTSDDFSACGGAMLDEWASDLLARLLNAPSRLPTLRHELRSRGVAAFGLFEAAA
jgi:hypothetical protein